MPRQGPPQDSGRSRAPPNTEATQQLRRRMDDRVESLRNVRLSWWSSWQDLAKFILPRDYRWLAQPNRGDKGTPRNRHIINSVGTQAARNCASGMVGGTTSQSRPWFRLAVPDPEMMRDSEVQVWCDEVTRRLMRIMAASNYYTAKGVQYLDLVVFGTAPLVIYEDNDNVVRCFNPTVGEFFCYTGPNFDVVGLAREFTMTSEQIVSEFTYAACSISVKTAYDNFSTTGKDQEFVIRSIIEPNPSWVREGPAPPDEMLIPRHFRYRELTWEASTVTQSFLRAAGFHNKPFSCPRWDVIGNDAYGRSPGMDALPDIMQLQLEELRKAQGIEKQVNPPMVADVSMKNEPASLLPGAVTYAPMGTGGVGFKPAIDPRIPLADMTKDIAAVEKRIRDVFFNDLFLMISQLDTVRSATEIDARREEKLIMLGPALDRIQREGLASDIDRIFSIAARRGLLPPIPDVMRGMPIKVEYISLLADLQRASAASGIERLWGFAGNISAAKPDTLDNLDADATIEEYAELMRVPPRVLTSKMQRAKLREKRNAEQQQAAAMQIGAEAVNAGKVLSETEVGGGQNALGMMLNGGG